MSEPLMDPHGVAVVAPIVSAVFGAAALIAVYRIIKGPTIMDRAIGTDVFLATTLGSLGSFIALTGRYDILPVFLAASMFAAVGTIAVSRYISRSSAALGYSPPATEDEGDGTEAPASDVDSSPAAGAGSESVDEASASARAGGR